MNKHIWVVEQVGANGVWEPLAPFLSSKSAKVTMRIFKGWKGRERMYRVRKYRRAV